MAQVRACRECGLPLPGDAPGGACPVCSLQTALKFGSSAAHHQQPSLSEPGRPATQMPEALARFGDYELIDLVARGGMGIVYKARQISLNRTVALKMIQGGALAGAAELKRFQAEAEAIAHLHHPNIIAIHEVGEHQGQHFFSMDFVAGRTLADVAREGPLAAVRAANYIKTTADAIHYAHRHGIVHRDLKPANVIIDEDDQPRIADFGLAKKLTDSEASSLGPELTLSGQVIGSPNYLAPEQAEPRRGTIGPASDVYSLGAILYHLVTGRPPFQAESLTTLLRQVVETDAVPPKSLNPSIPTDIETICLKCLEKEPSGRYASAQALADELGRFIRGEPILARPVGTLIKGWKLCRRRPVLAGLSASLILTLVVGLGLVSWQVRRAQAGELLAQQNLYAADMNAAYAALDKGDLGAALGYLQAHVPAPGRKDLRNWEWRYLWQRCRSDQTFELTRSTSVVNATASSGTGWGVLRNERSGLEVWDIVSGKRAYSLGTNGSVGPFACSPRSNLLAFASDSPPSVRVLSLDTGEDVAAFPLSTNAARFAFSPDAKTLFTLAEDGTLSEWNMVSRQRSRADQQSLVRAPEWALALSSKGVVALRQGNGLQIWEPWARKQVQLRLSATGDYPTAVSFSPDGDLLAAGMRESDSEIYVWNVEDLWGAGSEAPTPRAILGKHRDWVSDIAFSPDGRSVASAGADSGVRVWEIDHPQIGRRYQGHQHHVVSIAWAAEGTRIITSGADGSVRVWDPVAAPLDSGPRVIPVSSALFCFGISQDGKRALVLTNAEAWQPGRVLTNGVAVIWDTIQPRPVDILAFAGTNNTAVAWSPDDSTVATADAMGHVRIWDLPTRREVTNMFVPGYWLGHLHFSHGGRFLACGMIRYSGQGPLDGPRSARIWSCDGWREVPIPPAAVDKFLFGDVSSDGRFFASLHWGGALDIWDLRDGSCRNRSSQPLAGPGELGVITFSPDGRTCASSTQKGVLWLWDAAGRRRAIEILRTAQEFWNLKFSPDGTRLLLGGKRASDVVRLLDLNSQRFVANLSGPADLYWHVGMSGDNSTIFAVGSQRVLIWRAPSWAEIDAAEKGQVTQ